MLVDRDKLKSVKYSFVVAIEICIDIGNHVIASEGLQAPENYGDVFVVLGRAEYVEESQVPTLIAMTGFRNLLVHGYAHVDDARVVDILRSRLDDLDRFAQSILTSTDLGDGADDAQS